MHHPRTMTCLVPLALGALLVGAAAAGCGEDFQSSGGGASSSGNGGGGSGGAGTTSSSSSSSGSSSSSSGTGGTAPACEDFGDACSLCEIATCEEIYCNCRTSIPCPLFIACLGTCDPGYNDCTQNCYTQYADGIADAALVGHCAATDCAASCDLGLQPLGPCDYCLFESCEETANACLAQADCAQLLYCAGTCTDPVCLETCMGSFPEGAGLAQPLRDCVAANCPAECAWAG